jgi:PAS domain S-box-containing protein
MISTSIDGLYEVLARNRVQWVAIGILCIFLGGVIISLLVKKVVTGPLRKKAQIIKRIADGEDGISARLDVSSRDEMGDLAESFNKMLERLQRRSQENRRLFQSVEKGKAEWMATFDSIHDLISIHDKEDRIIRVNTALAKRCGKRPGEIIGMSCAEVFYGGGAHDALCPHRRTVATGSVMEVEVDTLSIEGTFKITTFPIKNETGGISAVVHVARDITMEKDLGEKLLHAEKLSSMGKLVAGIAHELNNPLMGIMGFSQLLMDSPDGKTLGEVKGKLEKIYHESMRTARIVQNLLTFARATGSKMEYADINELIRNTLELREYSLRSNNIEVRLSLAPDLPLTMVDKYQMQQVFINVINNAEDAMLGASGRGVLEITTKNSEGRIEIIFADDGPGVPREILGKVFDPFFTTKDVGRGTGLGLSITHGILAEHGGDITLENRPEGGALARISIPVREEEAGLAGEAQDRSERLYHVGEKSVLLVEDEPSIRESISAFLEDHGLTVDEAQSGAEALSFIDEKDYDVILTDLKMAGMSGVELYREATKRRPNLRKRFVMLTGDVFSEDTRAFFEEHGCTYLLKPFELPDLMAVLEGLLGGGKGRDKGGLAGADDA